MVTLMVETIQRRGALEHRYELSDFAQRQLGAGLPPLAAAPGNG
jgi:hypothetical protein